MNLLHQPGLVIVRPLRLGSFAVVTAAVVALTACATSSRFETSGAGHAIVATVHGSHTVESRDTHATIATASRAVTIERTRSRIDDGTWQPIPADVPVRVTLSERAVSVRAGAVMISRMRR